MDYRSKYFELLDRYRQVIQENDDLKEQLAEYKFESMSRKRIQLMQEYEDENLAGSMEQLSIKRKNRR